LENTFFILKIEAARCSETSVSNHCTTQIRKRRIRCICLHLIPQMKMFHLRRGLLLRKTGVW